MLRTRSGHSALCALVLASGILRNLHAEEASGDPQRKLTVFSNFTDKRKLGDKPLKSMMDEAIDNWNKVKD
jgi:hypothetical protein